MFERAPANSKRAVASLKQVCISGQRVSDAAQGCEVF